MGPPYEEEWNWPSGDDDQGVEDMHEDDYDPLSPVKWRQVAWVIVEFLGIFIDWPGTVKGWEQEIIITPPDIVIRTLLYPVPMVVSSCCSRR